MENDAWQKLANIEFNARLRNLVTLLLIGIVRETEQKSLDRDATDD